MIDISISSLEGLRTKCATSNDLTQKEIRTLEGKLVKYFSRQLSYKNKVPLQERNVELDGFPRLTHWFRIVNMRKEVTEEISPGELTLEALLEMGDEGVSETLQKFGASEEECARLNASLTCLRSAHQSGDNQSKQDWSIQWPTSESGKENTPVGTPEPGQWVRLQLAQSPKLPSSRYSQHLCHSPQALAPPFYALHPHPQADRLTVDSHSGLLPSILDMGHRSLPPSPRQRHFPHTPPRTPLVVNTMTPPGTPPVRRRNKLKAPGTPPPSTRKLIHLLPGFTALHRSKSHEFQLGNRVDDAQTPRAKKKAKPLNLKIHSSVAGSCENLPTQRSPLHSDHSLRSFFFPSLVPSTPPVHATEVPTANTLSVPRWSPQIPRRDLGNSIKHRLKCHNKCTKEAPPCHLLIYHRGARQLVRTESVPCDINNPLRYTDLHISQTLPKTNKINKDHIPVPYQPDSSSNPSSTTSSTPSSPAPPLPPSATPPSPLHPSPQSIRQPKQPNLTATSLFVCIHFITLYYTITGNQYAGDSADEFEEMNLSLLSARNFPRKASQTSIFLQEWDIPFEQLEIGELIGKGRFGQVYHGRWHGEVAIRLIDIERDNEDQLKAFKREVMAYRNTRHENVVLFMGVCMTLCIHTPHCILHKDMKSKNVFYDNGKVVITDFGLFTISGVLQAGRREDKLRIPSGWLCHLAPEIIRQLSPETAEDQLPFSKQSDVFAFGYTWSTSVFSALLLQLTVLLSRFQDILLFCWAHEQEERPSFSKLVELLEKLPKRNRRLSHPGHFWKSAEYVK
uniref:Kinase suppressor of ras 2 n=1 Tax=Astyanax mexicanus TaxID=7994 RepID=A0A8B9JJY1_ASTMX